MVKWFSFYCGFFAMVLYANMTLAQQIENNIKIQNKINSIRKVLGLKNLVTDSVLSKASEMLEIKRSNTIEKVDKKNQDEVINLLRKNHIYDYDIRSIVMEGNTIDVIDFENNRELSSLLRDRNFNKIGFSTLSEGNKVKVRIVLTENFISFDKGFGYEATSHAGCPPSEYLIISGKSNIDNLYFHTSELKELPDRYQQSPGERVQFQNSRYFEKKYQAFKPREKKLIDEFKPGFKEKLQDSSTKYFELRVNLSKSVVFADSTGKVLAFIPTE
jgi:hypothetical protein